MKPPGGQHMSADQIMHRLQRRCAGSNLFGQRREAEIDALPGVALGLAIQWLVLAELLEQDRRQQVRPRPSAWCRMQRCR